MCEAIGAQMPQLYWMDWQPALPNTGLLARSVHVQQHPSNRLAIHLNITAKAAKLGRQEHLASVTSHVARNNTAT